MWSRRRLTHKKVARLQNQGDVDGLRAAAAYADPIVDRDGKVLDRGAPLRAAAVRALQELAAGEDAHLVGVCAQLLEDPSEDVVVAAADALAAEGSADACWALVDALAARGPALSPEVRESLRAGAVRSPYVGLSHRWAAHVVDLRPGSLDDQDHVELMALMEADDAANPVQRLFEVLWPELVPDGAEEGVAGHAAEQMLAWCMPASFDGLAGVLDRSDVPEGAVRLAGLSGDQSVRDPLVRLLGHPRASLRCEAAAALGLLCDTETVLPLLDATTDSDVRVRRSAVTALDALGSAGVTAAIAVLARSGRWQVGGQEAAQELHGDTWLRGLGRLIGLSGSRSAHRSRGAGSARYAGLMEARARYQEVLAEGSDGQAPGAPPPDGDAYR